MSEDSIDLTSFIKNLTWCESLTLSEIKTLIDFTELVQYKKGDIIAEIGEVGEALFIVVSGEVALLSHENQTSDVGSIKDGEIMGEMSFFDRRPRSVRLQAVKKTKLLKLTRSMYQRMRIEHPYITVNILEHAIVSLDRLFRRASKDVTTFADYFYAPGRK